MKRIRKSINLIIISVINTFKQFVKSVFQKRIRITFFNKPDSVGVYIVNKGKLEKVPIQIVYFADLFSDDDAVNILSVLRNRNNIDNRLNRRSAKK